MNWSLTSVLNLHRRQKDNTKSVLADTHTHFTFFKTFISSLIMKCLYINADIFKSTLTLLSLQDHLTVARPVHPSQHDK